MAVGLIKLKKASPTKFLGGLFGKTKNQKALSKAQGEFDSQIEEYKASTFNPLDVNALRRENVFEDLQVNTKAADFAREQSQQSQANIMQGLAGAAGSSGIAGLAQALAGQGAQQARQASLSIGQQEQQNQKIALGNQDSLARQQMQLKLSNQQGARQFEANKRSTLMGVAGQQVAGAQQAIANKQQMWGDIIGGIADVAGSFAGGDIGGGIIKKALNL